ncbi:MAG: anaerobic C4-dicarboxylate transporter [Bacteroidia bacterium]|jgi:anaerobic C4-dicarboxylate transporter DcuA|nr:anaerobic C4-dicarboxylate transporter [Bacteroidia bacterium]
MFWIQLIVLLALILMGAQMKGIGLGIMGALGVLIYVYVFQLPVGSPPIDVMLIILCVVTAAASLQVSGGMDYLVSIAEKIIRSNPKSITFIGPLVTFFFTLLAGTAHISYSLLPIIAEVSAKTRVRPERPLSISVVAAHFGIVASPITAATVGMLTELNTIEGNTLGLVDIVKIVLPASIVGLFAGALAAHFMGKDLDKDPEFLKKMEDPEFRRLIDGATTETATKEFSKEAKRSVLLFLTGVAAIIVFGLFPQLRKMGMVETIELIMLSVVLLNVAFAKTAATAVAKSSIFRSGTEAVVSIFGVVWMSNTFIGANESLLNSMLQDVVSQHVWVFGIAVFVMAALLFSQAATVKAVMPLGIKLGILPPTLIAMYPAVCGDFFIPSYPTLVAAINFDKTGTTKVGKYLLNHSFMLPGLVMTLVTVLVGMLLSSIMLT